MPDSLYPRGEIKKFFAKQQFSVIIFVRSKQAEATEIHASKIVGGKIIISDGISGTKLIRNGHI